MSKNSCLLNSSYNNESSKLHGKLIKAYTDQYPDKVNKLLEDNENMDYYQSGLDMAVEKYEYIKSDSFKREIGYNWEDESKIELRISQGLLDENGEPEMKFGDAGPYFIRLDGSKYFFDYVPLENFTESEVKELVGHVIYNGLGGKDVVDNLDFESDITSTINQMLSPGSEFYDTIKLDYQMDNIDVQELKKRVSQKLLSYGLVLSDKKDIIDKLENEPQEDSDNEDEIAEVKNSNAVVGKESYTKNSKDSATANVKMMLSFIPEFKSYTENEDGTMSFEFVPGELTPVKFKDMDQLWRKIEDKLSNIFTKNVNGEVVSAIDQMMDALYELGKEDPTVMFVWNKLNNINSPYPEYKRIQFAQAFLKQQIIFYTADVKGQEGSMKFTFFDSNKNTSKEYQLRSLWEIGGVDSDLFYKVQSENRVGHTISKKNRDSSILKASQLNRALIRDIKAKGTTMSIAQKEALIQLLNDLVIPIQSLDNRVLDKVLKTVLDEAEPGVKYNELKAALNLINSYITPALEVLNTVNVKTLTSKNGNFSNPLKSNDLTTLFSKAQAVFQDDMSENTMMGAGNKMVWGYSMPTYIDVTINRIKNSFIYNEETNTWDNPYLDSLRSLPINRNSEWLKWLSIKDNADQFFQQTFLSFQKNDASSTSSVDNKDIKYLDQFSDQINKYLNGVKKGESSIYYTPTPADKGRAVSFSGPKMVGSTFKMGNNGGIAVATTSRSVAQISRYFEDEYTRMQNVWNTITNIEDINNLPEGVKLYVHKHIVKGEIKDKNGVPVGNGFKSQLFPELSPTYKTPKKPTPLQVKAEEVRAKLYNTGDRMKPVGITKESQKLVKEYIAQALTMRVREGIENFKEVGIVSYTRDKNKLKIENKTIDVDIWNHYKENAISTDELFKDNEIVSKIAGDYVINGIISNIEYSKVFSGDLAYYKNAVDYSKRIPATYTDGKQMVNLNSDNINFNIAVIDNVILEASNLDKMIKAFEESLIEKRKYMPDHIAKLYTDTKIKQMAKDYAKPFEKVNAADAQAWITLDRWKFIKEQDSGWSPKMEEAYQRLKNGTFTVDDLKLAAQPLKGVYFNRDEMTGVPTYLKYSQAVLIPGMFKGTSLENITEAMKKNEIDELITLDGVKSGALNPTKIHNDNDNGNFIPSSEMKFNTYQMSNMYWKLQQDLPVKGMKKNMDLGSQIQKNIISNINMDKVYGKMDGVDITGREIVELINETISELTEIGFQGAIKSIGVDENGKITNRDKLYKELGKQLIDKNMPSFIVSAIKRGYALDAIPQVRYKAQNVISSIINNAVGKTITPGGSMIQISSVGVTVEDVNNIDPKTGIYMLKDVKSLSRPKLDTANNTVNSGQVFIPHTFIAKYIPNYRELSREELFNKMDKRLLDLIGYRIPNQKMSSIQPLEIVGILPPSMGDSIMMYTEITTQTGSDFDIDKTYIMMPEFYYNEEKDYLGYVKSYNPKNANKKLENILKKLYPEIKLTISNNPVWEEGGQVFNQKEYTNQINYRLKAADILSSDKAKQVFEKGTKNGWNLNKILTELQIPKEQKQIILDKNFTDREEIITSLLADNSFVVEVNTATKAFKFNEHRNHFKIGNDRYWKDGGNDVYYKNDEQISKEDFFTLRESTIEKEPSDFYSNLTVPGGTNYTENEIATPDIVPNIKGHAQFSTDKGIGWFRSDDKVDGASLGLTPAQLANMPEEDIAQFTDNTKTRRILELQSDLFQKGRDKKILTGKSSNLEGAQTKDLKLKVVEDDFGYILQYEDGTDYPMAYSNESKEELQKIADEANNTSKNQFLQLLNKKNNWVTFFVKSIIQDSAKKGYEKVLFPKGDTAAKIEGHQTLEGFKKQKEDRIKILEQEIKDLDKGIFGSFEYIKRDNKFYKGEINDPFGVLKSISENEYKTDLERGLILKENELKTLKQELADVESGQTQLSSIAKFYEETVSNVLKKNGFNPKEITDEYGNKWNEIGVTPQVLSEILLQKDEADQIIGQANIKAMTVLIDAVNQKEDTLPHEYAHHYIAWNRENPIVQEGIKKWGSEEALVQAIGEQAVKQKGQAWDWWNKFVKWLMGDLENLSKLTKEELSKMLTDAFLTRQDLNNFSTNANQNPKQLKNQLFELYNMILKDPSTYVDMMSSIDSQQLKNSIEELHGKDPELNSLQLFDPTYQLKIKFDNSIGKSGVGLTANQMVDHVYTQIFNQRLRTMNMGIGNVNGEDQDLSGVYDTDGGQITDTISMFLNAFVDIAKDPYITKGNYNSVTSNIVFYMIRSGVPLDFITKYIGQPAFKEAVKVKLNSESLITSERSLSFKEAINEVISEYTSKLEAINKTKSVEKKIQDAIDDFGELSNLNVNRDLMVDRIQKADDTDPYHLKSQLLMLNQLKNIDEQASHLTKLVLASKADVNGGGPDIASHIVNVSRYNEVMSQSLITGNVERFASNSMIGSKTQKTLTFLNNLDEELFLTTKYKSMYSFMSMARTGSKYIQSKDFAKDIENQLYSQLMEQVLNNTEKYSITHQDMKTMFKSNNEKLSIYDQVEKLKENPEFKDNDLIQNLELKQVGQIRFVSLDNFKNKPSSSLDDISRGWEQLFKNPSTEQFAADLVKYSFATSGFSRNRNSIYDVLPLSVSDDLNRALIQFQNETDIDAVVSMNMMTQFLTSVHNEKWVTKRLRKDLAKTQPITKIKDIETLIGEKLDVRAGDLMLVPSFGAVDEEIKTQQLRSTINRSKIINFISFMDGQRTDSYYENHGVYEFGDADMEYILLSRVTRKGINENGVKIYEPFDNQPSIVKKNNPVRKEEINSALETIKSRAIFDSSYEEQLSNYIEKDDALKIIPSERALDNLTRRGIMQKSENCK